jgi:hypothetical protein
LYRVWHSVMVMSMLNWTSIQVYDMHSRMV